MQDYTASYTVKQSPEEVYAAINRVRDWWGDEIEGETDRLGAEFEYHALDLHHTTQRITELEPAKRVVWRVVDSRINFVEDVHEWEGTDVIFEIIGKEDGTELRFKHVGLVPEIECFGQCSSGWNFFIRHSLYNLITTGRGEPLQKATAEAQIARM